jgi:hypothetical protein
MIDVAAALLRPRRAPLVAAAALLALCLLSSSVWPTPLLSPQCVKPARSHASLGGELGGLARGGAPAAARRWSEVRRCLAMPAPCSSETASELPASPPPYAELEAHFKDMLALTAPLRGLPMHSYANWRGPWIENEWIAAAACADFRAFYPLVPLFVQLTDACVMRSRMPSVERALLGLVRGLRRDVVYVIVAQDDSGLCFLPPEEDCAARNILVLSSGGWGNVALPLIRSETAPDDFGGGPPPPPPDARSGASERGTLITFAGLLDTSPGGARRAAIAALRAAGLFSDALLRHYHGGPEWKAVVHDSVLPLAPRGYGRASFRSSELVQMGLPQLYVYDDAPWLPYWDPLQPGGRPGRTDVWGPDGLGFFADIAGLGNVTAGLCAALLPPGAAVTPSNCPGGLPAGPPFRIHAHSRLARMRARALELAVSHFTYAGVIERIREYLDTPWDADLVCVRKPPRRH